MPRLSRVVRLLGKLADPRVLLLLSIFLLYRYVLPNFSDLVEMVEDTSKPSTFFHNVQLGVRGYILRPWRLPVKYRLETGATKQIVRHQRIPELRDGPRPASYGCMTGPENPLVFIGVFTTAAKAERRDLLRKSEKPIAGMVDGSRVEFKFIVGMSQNETERAMVQEETELYDDIVQLEMKENMNEGKTYAFYRYLATRQEPTPQFAFKVDDDALIVLPNLVKLLDTLSCTDNVYIGSCIDYSCGMSRGYEYYFTGMAYGLSAPLFQWIGNTNLRPRQLRGMEDVQTARYLLNLREDGSEPLTRLNLDGRMGDWRYWNGEEWQFDPSTVIAIHGMKTAPTLNKIIQRLGSGRGLDGPRRIQVVPPAGNVIKGRQAPKKMIRRAYRLFAKPK